jgi:hypothetical protein
MRLRMVWLHQKSRNMPAQKGELNFQNCLLEVFFEQIGADGLEVVAEQIARAVLLFDGKILFPLEDAPAGLFEQRPRPSRVARRGVELSDQTLCGWTAQCAQLLEPLYQRPKRFVLASKVVGTDDTPVKVLDRKWPQTRKGRIWPHVGDEDHVAAVYDHTPTRERAGPEEFLKNYRGHL